MYARRLRLRGKPMGAGARLRNRHAVRRLATPQLTGDRGQLGLLLGQVPQHASGRSLKDPSLLMVRLAGWPSQVRVTDLLPSV